MQGPRINEAFRQQLALTALMIGVVVAANLPPPWPQLGIMVLIVYYGGTLLDRIPPAQPSAYRFETAGSYLKVRIDNLIEEDFEVAYVDDWQAGRKFAIYGKVVENEDIEKIVEPMRRVEINIYPTNEWFESSVIGYHRVGINLQLPYQIAYNLLQEIRQNLDQVVEIGFLATDNESAISKKPICSFSMTAWNTCR